MSYQDRSILDMLDIFVMIGHRHDISPFLVCILSHIVGPVGLVGPEGLDGPLCPVGLAGPVGQVGPMV